MFKKKAKSRLAILSAILICVTCMTVTPLIASAAAGWHGWIGDWLHRWEGDAQPSPAYFTQGENGRLDFNGSSNEQLILNNLNVDSNAEHGRQYFPAADMKQKFTVEFDINFSGAYLAFCFLGNNGDHLLDQSVTVTFVDSWTFIKTENIAGGPGIVMGDNNSMLRQNINGAGDKHVVINWADGKLSVSVGGEAYWTDYALPTDWIGAGYMGLMVQGTTSGYIQNLMVTNGVTNTSKTYFAVASEPADPQPTTFEGWTLAGEANSAYQIDDTGVLYFNALNTNNSHLYLNSDLYGTENDNYNNFNPTTMTDYTIEFDMSINEVVTSRGYLSFTLVGDNNEHLGNNGVVMVFNGDVSAIKYEVPAVLNFGALEDAGSIAPQVGNGTHHVIIRKAGNTVDVIVDETTYLEGFEMPATVPGANGNTGTYDMPSSGYIGFMLPEAAGYLANIKVTNDVTDYSQTFFTGYGENLSWEIGGGDKTDKMSLLPYSNANSILGTNTGEYPTNTASKFKYELNMEDISFTFSPKAIVSATEDATAWMGFSLMDTLKDYNTELPSKTSGLVAEFYANDDGTAKLYLKSLLPDETFGEHTTTVDLAEFDVDKEYTVQLKQTEAGTEVYWAGTKVATLDWLDSTVFDAQVGYLSFGASNTKGTTQQWVISKVNGENAADYLGSKAKDDDGDNTTPTTPDEEFKDDWDTDSSSPDTGVADNATPIVLAILAAGFVLCGLVLRKKQTEN